MRSNTKIEFYRHNLDRRDISAASEVLKSIFLTTGKAVRVFEEKFSGYTGCKNTVGVTSCTAALHLALIAWGIGPGDEVITTPMSFCATSNAVLHAGARPVFVDVEESTGNINAELMEKAVTRRTKAIIPVHLYGQMCDMKEIRRIADRRGLVVIEDAAHSIESVRDGIRPGELGDAACFSFYATKNITSGEGGAIATNDSGKAGLIKSLRLHGIDKSAAERYSKIYRHWDMPLLGWKYNMDNIHAALLAGQIERIEKLRAKRERIARRYERAFDGAKGIGLLKPVPGSKHARHLFTIQVASGKRDRLLHSLQQKGIGVAVNYTPIHLLGYYRKNFGHKKGDFPVAEKIGARTISLPLYPKLKPDEADYVISRVLSELPK